MKSFFKISNEAKQWREALDPNVQGDYPTQQPTNQPPNNQQPPQQLDLATQVNNITISLVNEKLAEAKKYLAQKDVKAALNVLSITSNMIEKHVKQYWDEITTNERQPNANERTVN